MKKIILFILLMSVTVSINASSGALKKNSIITCDNETYGYHSSDKHYHIAYEKNNTWYSSGDSLGTTNPCTGEVLTSALDTKNEFVEVSFNKCVDGDTIKVLYENEVKTVRFLAIDTPETVHPSIEEQPFGKEASNFTCESVKNATKLELEFDAGSDKFDKYDRLLAFVRVDGVLLQDELVKKGYATVAYLYGDYKHTSNLQESERIAKTLNLGVHSLNNESSPTIDVDDNIVDLNKDLIINLIKKYTNLFFKLN